MTDIKKFQNIQYEKRTKCMACDSPVEKSIFSFPDFPLTETYTREIVTEKAGFVDLEFQHCKVCGHGQLQNIIAPELLYGETYFFRTSVSKTAVPAVDYFLDFVNSVVNKRHFRQIVDIGSSDLYALKILESQGDKLIGIDPVLKGKERAFNSEKMLAIGELFEMAVQKHNLKFDDDLVLCSHTLEHVKDPKTFVRNILASSTEKTMLGFQIPGFEGLVEDARFDQVFHQHYNYYTVKSMIRMLADLDAELVDFAVNPYHWNGLMVVFRKKRADSQDSMVKFKNSLVHFTDEQVLKQLDLFKRMMAITKQRLETYKNENVYGYGAALMLPVLDYHLGNYLPKLAGIIDDDPGKEGLHYINLPITVINTAKIKDFKNSVIFLTATDNARILISKIIGLKPKKILLPHNKF